jgi:Domain of unknown function DUF29
MVKNAVQYEEDFYAWTVEQGRLLRTGELSAVDASNIAEEIESMGRSDRRELQSRLVVLIIHLLKWRFQPTARSSGWLGTIREQRLQIELILEDSPSLRPVVAQMMTRAYANGRVGAIEQSGLPEAEVPTTCPFTFEELLSESFLPNAEAKASIGPDHSARS